MSANERQPGGDHYRTKGLQHWDLMARYKVPYLEGNGSKYGYRWPKKNGAEDLDKFEHYVQKVLELHCLGQYDPPQSVMPIEVWFDFCRENGVDDASSTATWLILSWQAERDLLGCLQLIKLLRLPEPL